MSHRVVFEKQFLETVSEQDLHVLKCIPGLLVREGFVDAFTIYGPYNVRLISGSQIYCCCLSVSNSYFGYFFYARALALRNPEIFSEAELAAL